MILIGVRNEGAAGHGVLLALLRAHSPVRRHIRYANQSHALQGNGFGDLFTDHTIAVDCNPHFSLRRRGGLQVSLTRDRAADPMASEDAMLDAAS